MSERGVFAVDRGIWADPDFADEAFSEREAFLWLVSEAAWRPTRVRIGSAAVDLARGQCAFSTRFMAQKWKWSEARVRRFLTRLKNAGIIDASADARATHVTICKYDRFQRVSLPSDAPADAQATHSRRTDDAPATHQRRKEEDREYREGISSSLRSEPRTKARRKPEIPVDPNWTLGEDLVASAENCGLSRAEAAAEWPRFIDHALAKDVRHRDWVAAWRTWCRSPYRKTGSARASPPPRQSTADLWATDAFDAHSSQLRGRDEHRPFARDGYDETSRDPGRHPARAAAHGGGDWLPAQQSGGDTGQLPPLRLVGGGRAER